MLVQVKLQPETPTTMAMTINVIAVFLISTPKNANDIPAHRTIKTGHMLSKSNK